MVAKVEVLVAKEHGKSVTVPYNNEEPIFFLIQRVSAVLQEKEEDIAGQHLCINGGGIAPGVAFTDVSDTSGVRKFEYSTSAPPGRITSSGTNVECNCKCTPNYRVICPKAYGILEISQGTFNCPNCRRDDRIVPVTVGFTKCKYRFHGIKATGEQYTSDWTTVTREDCYQCFNPSKQIVWKRLVIESTGLKTCEDCTICLEPMKTIKTLGCGHRFHGECYDKWNSSCPNCRFNQHLITGRG